MNPFARWRRRRARLREARIQEYAAHAWEREPLCRISWSAEEVAARRKLARELREEARKEGGGDG